MHEMQNVGRIPKNGVKRLKATVLASRSLAVSTAAATAAATTAAPSTGTSALADGAIAVVRFLVFVV